MKPDDEAYATIVLCALAILWLLTVLYCPYLQGRWGL